MPISAQQHQAMHGEGFVYALACSAGLIATQPTYDIDGVDLISNLLTADSLVGLVTRERVGG